MHGDRRSKEGCLAGSTDRKRCSSLSHRLIVLAPGIGRLTKQLGKARPLSLAVSARSIGR